MERRRAVLLALIAVPTVGLAVYFLWPTDDEAAIRALLQRLARAVTVDPQETNPLARHARVHGEFAEIFTENVIAEVPDFPSIAAGRRAIADLTSQAGLAFATARVELSSIDLRMGESKKSCAVTMDATLIATRANGPERDKRKVTLRVDKIDGAWRIAAIGVTAHVDSALP